MCVTIKQVYLSYLKKLLFIFFNYTKIKIGSQIFQKFIFFLILLQVFVYYDVFTAVLNLVQQNFRTIQQV